MPPKTAAKAPPKVIYPSGVKEITEDLGADELIRRLKACAQAFQNMGQDDNNQEYIPLSMHLAQDSFLEHANKDVRLLVACCIADVFRVYAPDAPYKDPEQLKNIFLFFIKQLRGLEDPKDPAFKRYFYLLENLAWVKSFNICIELEENQDIFCRLFGLMFNIVNDDHSAKVKSFMLDMMAPLISEADSVSQELLDLILTNIIEPRKSQNRNAYYLARDLLKKTSSTIEPYIQAFFNNALILGKTSESDVASHLYELIYELNSISPSVLLAVLPQLEFKLKSNDEKERLDVTRLLARMFSDKDSELAMQHKLLWSCFLGRFNDISVAVRNRCVQYSMHFLLNHPELRADITEQLKLRQHDPEESVRYEVVMAIISAAKKDFTSISDELLDFVKERTLDKKFKIRKEALIGLSMIYKKCMNNPDIPESTRECVSWIKNKVLHVYYQTALEDRLLVERILHTCLVPYLHPPEDRMKKMYQLYATVDDHAVKAFNELLKCQCIVRNHVRGLLELHKEEKTEETDKQIAQKIVVLAKSLPEPIKAQEFLKKFNTLLLSDARVSGYLERIMSPVCLCREAEENVRELLKKLGNPVMTNVFYMTVKQLLERVAPVLVDKIAVQHLLTYVDQALKNDMDIIEELGSSNAPERGLKLLHTLSFVFPGSFCNAEIHAKLVEFLSVRDEIAAEITLQILINIGGTIEDNYPAVVEELIPLLISFTKEGTGKQAKHAVRCLYVVTEKREEHFGTIVDDLKNNLHLENPHFRTHVISLGHIAYYCPSPFQIQLKNIVTKIIVQKLLMQDIEPPRETDSSWVEEQRLSEETRVKIEGMKMMVRWLLGIKSNYNAGTSTLKLLTAVVEQDGDLMNRNITCRPEKAWLRMTAGCCILKIAQDPSYCEFLSPEQFQVVAKLINDECYTVRDRFAQKLHKGLITLKLPLDFMAIFALGAAETNRELKNQLKQYLVANINKRRDYLKQHTLSSSKLLMFLPDYVLPYAIHLLAHHNEFKKYDQVPVLNHLKDCLWFLMEPLITKNENYSFGFFKKLLENIKQTRDLQSKDDEMQNMKLYAVCDLALGLVLSKTSNFVLKEFPVEPTLPSKLYSKIDRGFVNSKIYLPPELASMFPKGLTLDLEQQKSRLGRDCQTGLKRTRSKPLNVNDQPSSKQLKESQDAVQEEQAIETMELDQIGEVPEPAVDGEVEISTCEGEPAQMSVHTSEVAMEEEEEVEEEVVLEQSEQSQVTDPSMVSEDQTLSESVESGQISASELLQSTTSEEEAKQEDSNENEESVGDEKNTDTDMVSQKSTSESIRTEEEEKSDLLEETTSTENTDTSSKLARPGTQPKENKQDSNSQPPTRVSARQIARRQLDNGEEKESKPSSSTVTDSEPSESKTELSLEPLSSSSAAGSSISPESSSSAPINTPTRRTSRRAPNMTNGANRTVNSDDDATTQEGATGSVRKSQRVQTRSANITPSTESAILNAKRKTLRRVR